MVDKFPWSHFQASTVPVFEDLLFVVRPRGKDVITRTESEGAILNVVVCTHRLGWQLSFIPGGCGQGTSSS
jgi:hypothetical protein